MKARIDIDQAALNEFGISITQFQEAIAYSLGKVEHPVSGQPLYIGAVHVTINVASPEVKKTTTLAPLSQIAVPKFADANISLEE